MSWPGPSAPSLNIGLLDRLRAAAGEYLPIDAMAETADDRPRALADLDALSAFGFAIERHPYRGAAYRGPAGRLCPDQIEHELSTRWIGRRVAVWDRVASTNDLAAWACGSTSNDGLVVLADEQTAGRGRLGRTWAAPPRSSILMSALIFPPTEIDPPGPDSNAAWLTAMAAVATAEVVAARIGRPSAIKWPNDVRIDGRKIAGILVERPAAPSRDPADPRSPDPPARPAVIGIGLNVNLDADALPADLRTRATSIRIECGRPADRSEVARDLIRRLDHWYDAVRSRGRSVLTSPWRDLSEHLGRLVRVATPDGPRSGQLVDLDCHRGLALDLRCGPESAPSPPPTDPDIPRRLLRISLADVLSMETCTDPPESAR